MDREIEDIATLIEVVGAPVSLYGFSSGAVLALRAAAALGSSKVARLAVLEPPFDVDSDQARRQFREYEQQMSRLLEEGKPSEAVAFFLQDMLPSEVLEGMRQSPDWATMVAVAHTLAYDNEVMGDGVVPAAVAAAVTVPALVLVGGDSPDFKHAAADTLARALPHAQSRTLHGQTTVVPAEDLAPVLAEFFRPPGR